MGVYDNAGLVAWSRQLRTMTMVFALTFCGGVIVFLSASSTWFAAEDGPREMRVTAVDCKGTGACAPEEPAAFGKAVTEQENRGLRCDEEPAMTDVILFQRSGAEVVEVLDFEEALVASAGKRGWILAYCT